MDVHVLAAEWGYEYNQFHTCWLTPRPHQCLRGGKSLTTTHQFLTAEGSASYSFADSWTHRSRSMHTQRGHTNEEGLQVVEGWLCIPSSLLTTCSAVSFKIIFYHCHNYYTNFFSSSLQTIHYSSHKEWSQYWLVHTYGQIACYCGNTTLLISLHCYVINCTCTMPYKKLIWWRWLCSRQNIWIIVKTFC